MKCSNCGFENADESKFCKKCGTKLQEQQTPKFCRHCGHEVKQGALYCVKCGNPMQSIKEEATNTETVMEQNKKNKKIVGIVVAIVIVVAVVLGALWITQGGLENKENDTTESEQESEVESEVMEDTEEEEQGTEQIVKEELSAAEYQSLCVSMMDMTSAYGSEYENRAVNMAQTIVGSKIVSSNEAYRMNDMSVENIGRLIFGLGYSCTFTVEDEDYSLENHRDALVESGYAEEELYPFIYEKEEFVELMDAFYGDITEDQLFNEYYNYEDYGEYIGIMGADGGSWEYFDAYDIKENDDYIMLHASCFTGNNGGGENIYLYTMNVLFEKTENSVVGLRAVYVEGYENNITEQVASITASSELPDYNEKTYRATNLVDGDYTTPWVENVNGVGVGESIQIKLNQATWVQEFVLYNGYQSSQELFDMNGYVTKISVDFGNGVVRELDCSGYYYGGDIAYSWLDRISLEKPVYTDTITVTILGANAGNKYRDTCIGEIELH